MSETSFAEFTSELISVSLIKGREVTNMSAESALRENINRKGTNSYYYAHGSTANGPAWDGREEPRLLAKTEETVKKSDDDKTLPIVSFPEYCWADEKKNVKVYIDFVDADAISDDDITVSNTNDSFMFCVAKQNENKMYKLSIDALNGNIVSVGYKKKPDKFVLSLKKESEAEATWYQLRKK